MQMPLSHEQCASLMMRERVKLLGYTRALVGNPQTAEDILQQMAVLAIQKSTQIQDKAHFLGWMRTTAKHLAFNQNRKDRKEAKALNPQVIDMLAETSQKIDNITTDTLTRKLEDCLRQLTPRARDLLRMRYIEGSSSAEISRQLQQKNTTIYQAISRARQSLALCMKASHLEQGGYGNA